MEPQMHADMRPPAATLHVSRDTNDEDMEPQINTDEHG
jgi:hypothetical protein